jgi:hypothetical protein
MSELVDRADALTRPGYLGRASSSRRRRPRRDPIIRAGRIAGIPICGHYFIVGSREQKLFPHFGEAGTAIFAVKQVEYSGHDRTLA